MFIYYLVISRLLFSKVYSGLPPNSIKDLQVAPLAAPLGAISAHRLPVAPRRKVLRVQPITACFFLPSCAAERTADKPASSSASFR